jgi:hypothetical protein
MAVAADSVWAWAAHAKINRADAPSRRDERKVITLSLSHRVNASPTLAEWILQATLTAGSLLKWDD